MSWYSYISQVGSSLAPKVISRLASPLPPKTLPCSRYERGTGHNAIGLLAFFASASAACQTFRTAIFAASVLSQPNSIALHVSSEIVPAMSTASRLNRVASSGVTTSSLSSSSSSVSSVLSAVACACAASVASLSLSSAASSAALKASTSLACCSPVIVRDLWSTNNLLCCASFRSKVSATNVSSSSDHSEL